LCAAVDLFTHLHGAEFRRVGAAGAAGNHDCDDEHSEFAQHQDADQIDSVIAGAEFAEMENALLRDDRSNEKGDQENDRQRLPADPIEMMDGRGEPKPAWMPERQCDGAAQAPHEVDQTDEVLTKLSRRDAKAFEFGEDWILFGDVGLVSAAGVHLIKQTAKTAGDRDEPRIISMCDGSAAKAFEQPCAKCVELANVCDVDLEPPRSRRLEFDFRYLLLKRRSVSRCPGTGRNELKRFPGVSTFEDQFWCQCFAPRSRILL